MKTNLTTSGKVELTEKEVLEAIRGYAMKHKQLKPAIDDYLQTKLNVTTKRIQYSGSSLAVTAEVQTQTGNDTIKMIGNPKTVDKESAKGFKRENVGVFRALKDYFTDEQKKNGGKITYLSYDKVWETIKFLFPKLDERKFNIYIRDKRQLKNVKFDSNTKMIKIG